MPWQETSVLEERVRFVVEALQKKESMTSLCGRYGISRKTGYKWVKRGRSEGGLSGLREESRRPKRSPNQMAPRVEDAVLALRVKRGWGARKLQALLRQEGIEVSRSAVSRALRRRGAIREEEVHRPALQRFERSEPNELLQMDFKGELRLGDGGACYPLSVLDDHSRYGLGLVALKSQEGAGVGLSLTVCFERYGVPWQMLVDHGTPWWSSTNGHGLTQLGVFLIKQGIFLLYSGVRHPQTQGKVERFHRTLLAWLRFHGMPTTLMGFQRAFSEFLIEYNEIRPHEALGLVPPIQRYRPSAKAYQPNPPEWEYPEGAEVKKLSGAGNLYLGKSYFVCHALANERVRVEHFEDRVLISYRHMLIREINRTTGRSQTILKPYGPTGHGL